MKFKRSRRRVRRVQQKRDAALRAKANKLRARTPVRDRHLANKRHRNMLRAYASSGRRFPYRWTYT